MLRIIFHSNKESQKIYKIKILLYFHMTKDKCFAIDASVLQVLPESDVSKFQSFYTNQWALSQVFNKIGLQVLHNRS